MQPASIQVRNIHFELDEPDGSGEIPSAWHGDGLAVSRYFDTLSLFFPPGERFFISAVKAFAPQVTDPELTQQVKQFCAQEGVHSREHIVYNRLLDRFGYRGGQLEQTVETYLRRLARIVSPRVRLAITCAIEHFTAIFAHVLLAHPKVMERAHPRMAAIWRWHAAEENEHKAVAFDVYKATGGNYWLRTFVMLTTTVIFLYKITRYQFLLVPGQPFREAGRQAVDALRYFFANIPQRELWQLYVAYYRPSFHPWDIDNRHLLQSWRKDFAGSPYA